MRLKLLFLLGLLLVLTTRAQGGFRVIPGTETLVEGGTVEKLTVVSGNFQYNIRPPKGWSCQADEAGHKVVFVNPSGRSALAVQFTTNSPEKIPAEAVLRTQVLRAHPGATVELYAVCSTNYRPGAYFDLMRVAAPGLVQRLRHAYVPQPAGQVEFILTASDDEFALGAPVVMDMLRAFGVTPIKPK